MNLTFSQYILLYENTEAEHNDASVVQTSELSVLENSLDALISRIQREIHTLYEGMKTNEQNEAVWRELFIASATLQWVCDSDIASPSSGILQKTESLNRYCMLRTPPDV